MSGFSTRDQITQALSLGQTFRALWNKNFPPTTVAVANEYHTLFRGAGNPGSDTLFNTGTNLAFQAVKNNTTGGTSLQVGGAVQDSGMYKYLLSGMARTAAATTTGTVRLVDVIGFYRVTSVTTITAQATTNTLSQSATFTADDTTDICTYTSTTNFPSNILTGTRVRLTTTTTLPAPLALATDYYVVRVSDSTFKLATTYANAVAGTVINITDAGTGTHTISWLLPRWTNGAGVDAIIFNPNSVALGAATPNMSLGYTNSAQVASRATPTVLPVGKTACPNSQIVYTGATGAGKYNYLMPRQGGDGGVAEINTIQNSVSYVSGEYCVALIKELGEFPIQVLGQSIEQNFLDGTIPSLPRIYDGAALYFIFGSNAATPVNSAIDGYLNVVWN